MTHEELIMAQEILNTAMQDPPDILESYQHLHKIAKGTHFCDRVYSNSRCGICDLLSLLYSES